MPLHKTELILPMIPRLALTAVLLSLGMTWLVGASTAQPPGQAEARPSHIPIPRGGDPVDLEKLFEERLRQLDGRPDLMKLKDEDVTRFIDDIRQGKIKLDPRLKDQ